MSNDYNSVTFLNSARQAGRRSECLIGDDHQAIPITLKGDRYSNTIPETIQGPSLWVRSATAPNIAYPYMFGGVVASLASNNKAITLNTSGEVQHFKVGDVVTFYDVSSGAWAGGGFSTTTVSSISGNTITVADSLNNGGLAIAASDYLAVVTDAVFGACGGGSADVQAKTVVVLEDVTMTGGIDKGAAGYIKGTFIKSKVKRVYYTDSTSYPAYTPSNNPLLRMIDIQT